MSLERISNKKIPSVWQQKIANIFTLVGSTINFLGRTVWPIVDLVFRLWMANKLIVAGLLLLNSWHTAVLLAAEEYPIPGLSPEVEAFLSIAAQLGAGVSLLLGLATRVGALVTLVFALLTQIYYVSLDINLFWIALMAGYVLRGPGPISLDHVLEQGLRRSPLPFSMAISNFFNRTRTLFSDIYLLGLRLWLMLTLLVASHYAPMKTLMLAAGKKQLFSWLPLHSTTLVFGSTGIFLAFLFGLGFATRFAAILGFGIIFYQQSTVGAIGYPFYWMMVMAILFVFGPGTLSLDRILWNFLKRRYPQLSGKPAFSLENLPRVVIIGGGFGGITCAKALRHIPVKVTLIDRHNYHLFQPLLYQVATGGLSAGDIAVPIRSILGNQFNAQIFLGEVTAIDKQNKQIITHDLSIPYDYLVIATGATHSYFGKDQWAPYAPGLKRVEDAIAVQSRILETFELAELASSLEEQQRLLNFVIVGDGPTGVELAGAIAELAQFGMAKDYHRFDPALANIILVQSAARILPTFSEKISRSAQQSLKKIGVKVLTNHRVEQIDSEGVIVNGQRIYSKSVLWAAGVAASPAANWLDVEADPSGRIKVNENLSVPNYPDIFVIGDTAASNAWRGNPVPGLAPAAKQGGIYVAKVISARVLNKAIPTAFRYKHLGSLATIGRKSAVVEFNNIKISGAMAWWFWGLVHVSFLFGARNRISVIFNWVWSYFTFRANNLLITKFSKRYEVDGNSKISA